MLILPIMEMEIRTEEHNNILREVKKHQVHEEPTPIPTIRVLPVSDRINRINEEAILSPVNLPFLRVAEVVVVGLQGLAVEEVLAEEAVVDNNL